MNDAHQRARRRREDPDRARVTDLLRAKTRTPDELAEIEQWRADELARKSGGTPSTETT